MFDLLTTVEYGGCSAKLSPTQLAEALKSLPKVAHPNLLVDIETHDDAGVYRISDELALVQTTDFFSPICSDAYEFGQIAAANALSDVYAMGGTPLTALNLVMFPSEKIPLEILERILAGGQDKVAEADAVIVGGHTIDDYPPKYGLAVTGTVHPDHIVTNTGAQPGNMLLLTKALGTGILVAGQRIGEASESGYRGALESMKLLNRAGASAMMDAGVRSATDITGFSLLGHALKMAAGSNVSMEIDSDSVPLLDGALELADLGCIPGAAFRNQTYVGDSCQFADTVDYNRKMLMFDAQTSGGLFMAVPPERADTALESLRKTGHSQAALIGTVVEKNGPSLQVF